MQVNVAKLATTEATKQANKQGPRLQVSNKARKSNANM